jgi:hypothetical protein
MPRMPAAASLKRPASRLRAALLALACAALLASAPGCGDKHPSRPGTARTYRMGFAGIPPRADIPTTLRAIDLWSTRADWALILAEPPWDSLLAGWAPESLIRADQLGLVNYYRGKGLRIVVSVDPTNGLDRSSEAAALVRLGRSLSEPEIRDLYRRYCVAMDSILDPDWIGVASETNLIRAIAPGAVYTAVVGAANAAAQDIQLANATSRPFATVQVETAWGWVQGAPNFVGIAQDLADFPFTYAIGLSSYPYFLLADPDSLPPDYYTRLRQGTSLPMMVIEGGWTSDPLFDSSPAEQARYIAAHARLLDQAGAIGWFQLTFTDLDLTSFPPAVGPFARLGLVDEGLVPKPALGAWDAQYARRRR